jgi:hypothetical protein
MQVQHFETGNLTYITYPELAVQLNRVGFRTQDGNEWSDHSYSIANNVVTPAYDYIFEWAKTFDENPYPARPHHVAFPIFWYIRGVNGENFAREGSFN